jgi:phage/plasmid primase-like uncharacterized protein
MRMADPPEGMRLVKVDMQGGAIFRGEAVDERRNPPPPPVVQAVAKPKVPWRLLVENWMMAGWDRLGELADALNVSVHSLAAMHVGWSEGHRSWTFPMRDASARITGVRLRRPDGSKWAVKGSSEGLFYAPGKIGQTVYVAEGASDVAAMMTLGLSAVGKPSAQGGGPALAGMLAGLDVVLIADSDDVGKRGAQATAHHLIGVARRVRIVVPSVGKDVREWVRAGADAHRIRMAAERAAEVTA